MAEFTNVAAQTVAANGNVVFSNTAVKGSNCIQHREGSGIITLRGLTNQCKARFFVDFSGNIAIPTGGTVGAISLAIAISGEPVLSSQMISTPAAVDQYNNVSSGIYVDVPRGCCVNIAVENTSDQAVSVANANIVVTREAIQGVNYNMAQNTCALQNTMNSNTRDIIDSQNAGTRAILDYLCNEKISNLQAENNDLRRAASQDRQSALLTTAMASQTQQLINAINPAPIPAYQVPNPNTFYGCGCNTGCNC